VAVVSIVAGRALTRSWAHDGQEIVTVTRLSAVSEVQSQVVSVSA
jgi:hypothetical protein